VWNLWSDIDNGNFNFPRRAETHRPGKQQLATEALPKTTLRGGADSWAPGLACRPSSGSATITPGSLAKDPCRMAPPWLTQQSNFTYGKSVGTGSIVQATSQWTVPDAYNLAVG